MEHMLLRATNIAILNNKKKTAQQLIGNGRGSFGLIGTIAVGYGPPAAKLLLGNCVHVSVENDHHVAVPVISLWSPCNDIVAFTVVCSHFSV